MKINIMRARWGYHSSNKHGSSWRVYRSRKGFKRHDLVNHSIDNYAHEIVNGAVAYVDTCEIVLAC
jgi:hypothetical protein